MAILYKCNVNPIKIPKSGFLEFTKLVLKFIEDPNIAETTSKKKEKEERFPFKKRN